VVAWIHPADQGDTQTLTAALEQAEAMLDLHRGDPRGSGRNDRRQRFSFA
jgi:hypothetical protein